MEILFKAAGNNSATGEFGSKFGWNRQPSFVIELAFEVVHCGHPVTFVVVFVFVGVTVFGNPRLPTNTSVQPTFTHCKYKK
jgi:hypothetical protein